MTTMLSAAAAIAMVNALTAEIDVGSELEIYDGAIPATADTALGGQQLLVTFPLNNVDTFQDAVDTVNGAVATANDVDPQDGLITATATWGRIVNSAGEPIVVGDVSAPAGNGAIKISSTQITQGVEVSVISLSYTQPKA